MIDKVQKVREEVARLQNELIQEKEKGYGSDVDDACILELQIVLTYIDSLQEEPVSEDLETEINYLSKRYPEVSFAKLSRIAVHVANWQKQQTLENKILALGDDLRKVSLEWDKKVNFQLFNMVMNENQSIGIEQSTTSHAESFIAGATWQKLKDMGITNNAKGVVTNILNSSDKPLDIYATEVAFIMLPANLTENYHMTNRDRISDAVRLGAKWQKEQDKETIELAEDHAMLAGIIKGTEHTIGEVRSILNKVAYENNGLDVNGDYCEQPYIELDNEFRKLLKEG